MPWRETTPMQERLEFVREYDSELFTMTELAAQYGISRKTAYKWLERYHADGVMGCVIVRGARITVRRQSTRSWSTH
jgi:transposase-like protein